jgi:hypothetical protein
MVNRKKMGSKGWIFLKKSSKRLNRIIEKNNFSGIMDP